MRDGLVLKTLHPAFQIGENKKRVPSAFVKNKEKPSTFFFIKGRMLAFLPKSYHKNSCSITPSIRQSNFNCGKPSGKSGKPDGKLPFFFTKTVENPVEKVKSSFRNGKYIHSADVLLRRKNRLIVVFPACGPSIFHCADVLECPAESWYNNNRKDAENRTHGRLFHE